ncbi:uncharacterized protein LOC143424042 [Xylocopa sonorina]|uniref:uncharacterized protein LOC143424042 n=1 Tax=Xylocopa sonorina TaxID=1818115 RepID=UPI00403AC59A
MTFQNRACILMYARKPGAETGQGKTAFGGGEKKREKLVKSEKKRHDPKDEERTRRGEGDRARKRAVLHAFAFSLVTAFVLVVFRCLFSNLTARFPIHERVWPLFKRKTTDAYQAKRNNFRCDFSLQEINDLLPRTCDHRCRVKYRRDSESDSKRNKGIPRLSGLDE